MFKCMQRLIRDQRGGVLITTGLGILLLLGVSGAAIDLGNQQLLRARTQQSSDAAALAGAALSAKGGNPQQVALRYFNLNFSPTYLGVQRPSPAISVGSNSLSVSATSQQPTSLTGFVGVSSVNAGGRTVVAMEGSNSTTAQTYDVILVMDNSGSMISADAGTPQKPASRIDALREAALTMTSALLNGQNASRMAGVAWSDRVEGRQDLTSNQGTMTSFLNRMKPAGLTDSTVGMKEAEKFARGFNPSSVHAVVLLTDGQNNSSASNTSTNAICSKFKSSKTLVYTIAFGQVVVGTSPIAKEVQGYLSNCASDNPAGGKFFYIAPDARTLSEIFATITTSIMSLRISE